MDRKAATLSLPRPTVDRVVLLEGAGVAIIAHNRLPDTHSADVAMSHRVARLVVADGRDDHVAGQGLPR